MEVKILDKTETKVKFLVKGIRSSFAGSLRRMMISEIPTMAIEWVDFRLNNSAMPDEVLANRIGQIPLTYDQKAYNLPKDCKCKGEGCSRCQVKLSLEKKGPCMVYSDDLKSSDKSVSCPIEKVPIVELFDDQELKFEATAILGTGREHSKWKGAIVGYKNLPDIKIGTISKDDQEKFVNVCPRHIFEIKGGKLTVTDPTECILCMNCAEASEKGEVEVTPVEDSFVFNVESASGLSAEEIVLSALQTLDGRLKEFKKQVKKLK